MEWRVFFDVQRLDAKTADLVSVGEINRLDTEERCDEYFVLKDPQFGLKLRSAGSEAGALLELKLRKLRKRRGAEKWNKVVRANVQMISNSSELRTLLVQSLTTHAEGKYAQSILECAQAVRNAPEIVKIGVLKTRKMKMLNGFPFEVVHLEFYLNIPSAVIFQCQSVCFEGLYWKNGEEVMESILRQDNTATVAGYPEFLYSIYNKNRSRVGPDGNENVDMDRT